MNKNKEFNVSAFVSKAFLLPMLALYIVLNVCDIGIVLGLPRIITRYIPIAITSFAVTFLVYKTSVKKLKKSDSSMVKKIGYAAPAVVAMVLLVYGLISVNNNMNTIKEEFESPYSSYSYSTLKRVYGEDEYNRQVEEAIDEARSSAISMWIVCSVIYVVCGEIAACVSLIDLENKMLADEVSPNMMNNINLNVGYNSTLHTDEMPINNDPVGDNTSSINWNL